MNYTTAIFLVREDVRAIAVSYEVDKDGKGVRPFTTFKTADQTVAVGDYVIVPTGTRHDMTVCRVEQVDIEVDLHSTAQVQWLVGIVDRTAYDAVVEAEERAIEAIKSAEKRRAREELAAKLIADNPDLQRLKAFDTAALAAPEKAEA